MQPVGILKSFQRPFFAGYMYTIEHRYKIRIGCASVPNYIQNNYRKVASSSMSLLVARQMISKGL